MGRMALEPYGAPEMTPNGWAPSPTVLSGGMTGWDGKNGIKCFFLRLAMEKEQCIIIQCVTYTYLEKEILNYANRSQSYYLVIISLVARYH